MTETDMRDAMTAVEMLDRALMQEDYETDELVFESGDWGIVKECEPRKYNIKYWLVHMCPSQAWYPEAIELSFDDLITRRACFECKGQVPGSIQTLFALLVTGDPCE